MCQRRLLLLLTLVALIQGCATWKQRPLSPGVTPAVSTERPVRITRVDRTVIVLEHPRVEGDSLIGDVGKPPQRVAVALRDVERIEERSVSVLRTGGLALGAGAIVWVLVVMATAIVAIAFIVNAGA